MSSCPICLETLSLTKASPDVCDHLFCLSCLTKWSKMESFCPIDRKRFKKIINLDTGTSCEIKRGSRKKRKSHTLYDVTVICEVCESGENDATLLLCDSCDLAYHCVCLTPPLSAVPSGRWFCPVCKSIDKKLKQREDLMKPSNESCQSFCQTSNCSTSTCGSSMVKTSSRNNSTSGPINVRKNYNREENCSKSIHSTSSLSASTSSQLCGVRISDEDYQTLKDHSNSVFFTSGFTVISDTTPAVVSDSNESHRLGNRHCGSIKGLVSNLEVRLDANSLPVVKNSESDIKNKKSNCESSSYQSTDIICESALSQLIEKSGFTKSNETKTASNLFTSFSNTYENKNHFKDQMSDVSVLKTPKQELESFNKEFNGSEEIRELSGSACCEIVYDSSNCINIDENLNSEEFQHMPKTSNGASQAGRSSNEIFFDNQSVGLEPAKLKRGCLLSDLAQTTTSHVCQTEDTDSLGHIIDSETRRVQNAPLAKMKQLKEFKQIEEEKRKFWVSQKRANSNTSCNLFKVPQSRKHNLGRTSSSNSKIINKFNIIEYTRCVKARKHSSPYRDFLNKYKDSLSRNAKNYKSVPEYDFNVFQRPFSQQSVVHGCTKLTYMRFDPSDIRKEGSLNKFHQTFPAKLRRDFEGLSMKEDGSLFYNWS